MVKIQRIALVTSSSLTPAMEDYIADLARILRDANYEVDLITPLPNSHVLPVVQEMGVTIRHYRENRSDDMVRRAFRLGRQIRNRAYDMIFLHQVPLVQAVAGIFPDETVLVSVLHRSPFSAPSAGQIHVNACNVRLATDDEIQQIALARIPNRPSVLISAENVEAMRASVLALVAQAAQGDYALPLPRHSQLPIDLAAFSKLDPRCAALLHAWRERHMPQRPRDPAYPAAAPTRVLLTGATGHLGAAVCRELVERGVQVGILLRPGSDCHRIHDLLPYLRIFPGTLETITEQAGQLAAFAPHALVHLAWISNNGRMDLPSLEANLRSTMMLLMLLQPVGCRYILGAGTWWEAAIEVANMCLDDAIGTPTPRYELYDQTTFAVAKSAVEKAALGYCACTDMPACWLRLSAVYGPDGHPASLMARAARQQSSGNAFTTPYPFRRWDMLHVRDAARAFVAALEQGITGVYEVASGETASEAELLDMLGYPAHESATDNAAALPVMPLGDGARFRSSSGWHAEISLRDGIRSTAAWWAAQPENS